MKKIHIVLFLMSILFLTSCINEEIELKITEYQQISSEPDEYYMFVYKTDCKYCNKDYIYINGFFDEGNLIYSYNLDYYEKAYIKDNFDLDIDKVPTLIHINHNDENEVVAVGYIKVRNYLLSMKNN